MNFEITQFNLMTNTPYLIKDGLCEVESYYFISDEYYITGESYQELYSMSSDHLYFEFININSSDDSSFIHYGDTLYLKMNDLFVSENNDLVALSRDLVKQYLLLFSQKLMLIMEFRLQILINSI